jgi:membrane-bound lytic murein transglycosylase B
VTPSGDRGAASVALAGGLAVALLMAVVMLGAAGGLPTAQDAACQLQPTPSGAAASIPPRYLADYQQAGRAYGIPWTILAGIGEVESGQGRSHAPGVHSGENPFGAAVIWGS